MTSINNIILFDSDNYDHFLPLVFNKPIGKLPCGIYTLGEKWKHLTGAQVSFLSDARLTSLYSPIIEEVNLIINATLLPSEEIVEDLKQLSINQALVANGELRAVLLSKEVFLDLMNDADIDNVEGIDTSDKNWITLKRSHNLLDHLGPQLKADFEFHGYGINSDISSKCHVDNKHDIFVGNHCRIEPCALNANDGPIYIGDNVTIEYGAAIYGPVSIGAGTTVKAGARIYGPVSIGQKCVVAGEIKRSIILDYSNKGHEGYLGDSIIGSFCNLGAGTTTSNLKNNFKPITCWDYDISGFEETNKVKLGTIMGDYSRTGIYTKLSAGTTIGVSSSIVSNTVVDRFVPSFTWLQDQKVDSYHWPQAIAAIEQLHDWKENQLDTLEKGILQDIQEDSLSNASS